MAFDTGFYMKRASVGAEWLGGLRAIHAAQSPSTEDSKSWIFRQTFRLEGKRVRHRRGRTGIRRMAARRWCVRCPAVLIASRRGERCEDCAKELTRIGASGSAEGFAGRCMAPKKGVRRDGCQREERTESLDILMNTRVSLGAHLW